MTEDASLEVPMTDDGKPIFYDKLGHGITVMDANQKLGDPEYRIVGSEAVRGTDGNYYEVSTIWLAVDYSLGRGSPLIFETMVFAVSSSRKDPRTEIATYRYSTEQQAIDGHRDAVAAVKSGDLGIEL